MGGESNKKKPRTGREKRLRNSSLPSSTCPQIPQGGRISHGKKEPLDEIEKRVWRKVVKKREARAPAVCRFGKGRLCGSPGQGAATAG